MIDINQVQERKPFLWKEQATNLLIANIPASVLIVMLKEAGISGVIPTLILLFGGMVIIGKIRESKGNIASGKTVLYAVLANIVAFFLIPTLLLGLFA